MMKDWCRASSVLAGSVRTWLVAAVLFVSAQMYGAGWTPTDGGLVVNMEQGERFLLSVWVDIDKDDVEDPGEEFFVINYNRYKGGYFNYKEGLYLKLAPQVEDATEPSDMSIWTVGAPLSRIIGGEDYSLGANAGHVYTIWNDGKTLRMNNTNYQFMGDLTSDYNYKDAADVVFVVPTDHDGITSFDPNRTLGRGGTAGDAKGRFNGAIGKGFLGMTYREVYMLDIPRQNKPISYTNAAVVCFNTTTKDTTYAKPDAGSGLKVEKGHAVYAYADKKHRATVRTIFRLYMLDKPFNYCSSYYFATDEQDFKKFRKGPDTNVKPNLTWTDSTETKKKIYTIDWMTPMTAVDKASSPLYKTDYMTVPTNDSTYYYVGFNNDYKAGSEHMGSGTPGAQSAFTKIRNLPLKDLPTFKAPAGAYGKMVVDTTTNDANLGVAFEPAGYFLKVSTGKNVPMVKINDNEWVTQDMWEIDEKWLGLKIWATLMTGPEFREDDPGADITGWTDSVDGSAVPVSTGGTVTSGLKGYAVIYTDNTNKNGNMTFVPANLTRHVRYDNNGFLGVEIPNQYPTGTDTIVRVLAPRLKFGYTFLGWTKAATPGVGDKRYQAGDTIRLSAGETVLYAQARYDGTLQMAISFKKADGKRYFLTHPGTATPRYARARHFDSWENTWQGMENAENEDPNYLSTFELRYPKAEIKKREEGAGPLDDKEHVLDPRQYTMKGYTDSLTFYEYFAPNKDEYLGLYYVRAMNTILANKTWAGLFTTTSNATDISWPNYMVPYIDSTKIKSERYVEEYDPENKKDSLILKNRKDGEGWLPAYVQYDEGTDQFNGVDDEEEGTDFQITAVIVADEHYIILPDTSYTWRDTIEFGYHNGEQLSEDVWSSLIGKQLMAVMVVDGDTTYFHPNRKKVINDPNNLYLSPDYRVTQIFEWIPDSRLSAALNEGDSAQHETTDHYWHYNIVSGLNSPLNVKNSSDQYIDIVDTFRIHMSHDAISKIKEYRGRWKKGATGLKVDNANGSMRHRDIIVRTKTYHYGADSTYLMLEPEHESYNFSPLAGQSQQLNFKLKMVTSRRLLDVAGKAVKEEILSVKDTTSLLSLVTGDCSIAQGDTYFTKGAVSSNHVTLTTKADNSKGVKLDTLHVTKTLTINGKSYTATAHVPLTQAALTTSELVWSVTHNGKRYFVMAVNDGSKQTLQFREFTQVGSMLYKLGSKTQLEKGSYGGNNSDEKYITPWTFAYNPSDNNQLSLETRYSIGKFFTITDDKGALGGAPGTYFTYRIAEVHTNDNSNYEEKVRIRYGASNWLKFDGTKIVFAEDSASATEFSWSYLLTEYSLLNNGTYPSDDHATFGYNVADPKAIQTRYKAYREYSMLLDNELTYLCHKEETSISNLTDPEKEWLTSYRIDTIHDRRVATLSGIDTTFNSTMLTTTVSATGESPINITYGGEGKYINIVDTLCVTLSLQDNENTPAYRFKGDWSEFKSISDANLKIPLVRKTYHEGTFSTLSCSVEGDAEDFTFPATLSPTDSLHEYVLHTTLREGTQMLDVDNEVVAITSERYSDVTNDIKSKAGTDSIIGMHLTNKMLAEVRLMDIYGNAPNWCHISATKDSSVIVKCTERGIRSPRTAYLYLAYIITLNGQTRFVNYRLTVAQYSYFEYANNQKLVHSPGASGDEMTADGRQQVHENKRILYYYPDQQVELPVRERAFYGWWRWYREGVDVDSADVSDTDVPDSLWYSGFAPRNTGKFNFPYRIIGDSVKVPDETTSAEGDSVMKLLTMGRWTVFHYKSKDYGNKNDPPAKTPRVLPPDTIRAAGPDRGKRPIVTYAVDISNYYDNLPLSLKDKNQVDVAQMETMLEINEPTLSLREIFELHPWTEMAEKLEGYKDTIKSPRRNLRYMEDHVMMAPRENALLLRTEQRYNYEHLKAKGHSESLLGYYMRDDNWSTMSAVKDAKGWSRQDSMIWCGGWDADCKWYTYNPSDGTYTPCSYEVSADEDFLKVPARKGGADTVYYCLRAKSKATTIVKDEDVTVDGDYWFNICRYKIIYHNANTYGPKKEVKNKDVTKALITKEEIEQRYDVLERLDFDYIQPGPDYHIYPHPLPWADASYGYTYPETSSLPHNRYHDESDFPNHGEYGLINRIPYSAYWRKVEQHGGAENGYMIYCDGMASAGQVAALTLHTHLCAGQKMFFSGYVGNPSSQTGKSNPSFIFSVQGSTDGVTWNDITSYMTGDIQPANEWYQIYFPILHNEGGSDYEHFRVRIYNVASSFDGNDFIIDDMCIFATKPPLIAYQAQTTCNDYGHSDEETHVLLRVDYQGITGEGYNGKDVCYTVRQKTPGGVESFVRMSDHYLNEDSTKSVPLDTLFGKIYIPAKDYEPKDSIYKNMNDLLDRFDTTFDKHKINPDYPIVREGYIYEILEGDIRPVKYIVHSAKMLSKNDYTVHMSAVPEELLSSICGMTSHLKISNRMVLQLNGEEQPETEQLGLCANATYDISLSVKGSMYLDSVAPIDVTGTCVNDWLLYGDTAKKSSKKRYGYYYSDIEKVVTKILRRVSVPSRENPNQLVPNLASVDSAVMRAVKEHYEITLDTTAHPYTILADLVNKGFLTLYQSQLTASVLSGDSVQFVIFPIEGSGSKEMEDARVEVCPNPILIKLKPDKGGGVPLMVGGLNRDSTESMLPIEVLTTATGANNEIKLRIDSIMPMVGIYSIELRSTDDPDYREGVHRLSLVPDQDYPSDVYYNKADSVVLRPAPTNNYSMKPGYRYTFDIVMQTLLGQLNTDDGCEVGTVPFIVSIVPDYVRWDPQATGNNNWNDADNWIGIDANDNPIHADAHFVPLESTKVIIPAVISGKPYPVVQPLPETHEDSIQKVGFQYNKCDTIRFMPGAAIGQQQYIGNSDVVIDMDLPNRQWAFRTAPVKGMVSGDLFIADADDRGETPLWEVGEFDASGRTYKTGNASFWLSVYNSENTHVNRTGDDSVRSVTADWSRVTNAMNLSLPVGQGFAVYVRTKEGVKPVVRLPKNDDIYYYYGTYGERIDDKYVGNLRSMREGLAGSGLAGKLAYSPAGDYAEITLENEVSSADFVFGNPTMGYIDIWGFIADNTDLVEKIGYMDERGSASLYTEVTKIAAEAKGDNKLTNPNRYLPPMHVMVLEKTSAAKKLTLHLYTDRIVTDTSQVVSPPRSPAPRRAAPSVRRKGIMTVTAKNALSARCTSHLLLGQGYHNEILEGEDAILTTINIDNYTANLTPTTPFNLYAIESGNGMSINLRDSIVNIPISFYMSDLSFDPVTQLWFTGVNNIDGPLVLYDALTDSERKIIDGICLKIETPSKNHELRYFIRRPGYRPQDPDAPIATGMEFGNTEDGEQVIKIIKDDQVLIIRNGHVYTMFGQKVR